MMSYEHVDLNTEKPVVTGEENKTLLNTRVGNLTTIQILTLQGYVTISMLAIVIVLMLVQ